MGLVLLLDLITAAMRPGYISEPMVALALGFILGPAPGFGILDLSQIGDP